MGEFSGGGGDQVGVGQGRGYGFRELFKALSTRRGTLRFRSDDQVLTIDFDELPTHFDSYIKGTVRGRTVVRIGADSHP